MIYFVGALWFVALTRKLKLSSQTLKSSAESLPLIRMMIHEYSFGESKHH